MSLRARLLLALGAVVLVALLGADVATYSALRSFLLSRVDQQLQAAHIPIEQALDSGSAPGGPGGNSPAQALQRAAPSTFVAVRTSSGVVVVQQDDIERGGTEYQPILPVRITGLSTSIDANHEPTVYFDAESAGGGPDFRVRASQLDNGNLLVLAVPLSDSMTTLNRLLLIELAVTGGALLLSGLVGWWLVRIGLRPLSAIEDTATNISKGELGHRVPGESSRTEVGRLAGVLNVMLSRIEDAFAARDATEAELRRSEVRMRRFVGDASHELRTPIAAVSAYAELFERGADERPEDLDRVMRGIRAETGRMGHLVDDLLLLARLDEGRPLVRREVEIVGLAAEAVEAAGAVGPSWPVHLEAREPLEILGDRTSLRQVFDNLLGNVRAHTPPGTSATIRIRRSSQVVVCEVEDNGPGIDADEADRLFERFYRADVSRSRVSGGSGLGLSIVQAIVTGHGGRVWARRRDSGGSVFAFELPLPSPDGKM